MEGNVFEFGKGDIERIVRLCYTLDKLQSRWSKDGVRHRERYVLKRAAARLRKRIRNIIDSAHCLIAKWLCEHYDYILIPPFESSKMVLKTKRNISSKTARM